MKYLQRLLSITTILTVIVAFMTLLPANAQAAFLDGTYANQVNGITLTITNTNESNGTFQGTVESDGNTLSIVKGIWNYSSTLQPIGIDFIANLRNNGRKNIVFQAWAGTAEDYNTLNLIGSQAQITIDDQGKATITTCPLGGPFVRQ